MLTLSSFYSTLESLLIAWFFNLGENNRLLLTLLTSLLFTVDKEYSPIFNIHVDSYPTNNLDQASCGIVNCSFCKMAYCYILTMWGPLLLHMTFSTHLNTVGTHYYYIFTVGTATVIY